MVKAGRIFYLDFIRAVSMIFIIIYHFNTSLTAHSINGNDISFLLIPSGELGIGVSVFLIISGAALMYTYQGDFSIGRFFKKRFLSLYPMFWMTYAIAFLYLFYINFSINHVVPKWTFILTIIGMDGYLLWSIPNFYILGEWFLGIIILLYLCFPILRKFTIKYPKSFAIFILAIYIILVENYIFKMPVPFNLIARLPEFLFGMYFIRYSKKVNVYQFVGALCIGYTFLLVKQIPIQHMYKETIMGISIFIVLAFIGQRINFKKLKAPFLMISKYSYAIFLVHHVVIGQVLTKFNGRTITPTETHLLFLITCIFIAVVSVCMHKLSAKINGYITLPIKSTLKK